MLSNSGRPSPPSPAGAGGRASPVVFGRVVFVWAPAAKLHLVVEKAISYFLLFIFLSNEN